MDKKEFFGFLKLAAVVVVILIATMMFPGCAKDRPVVYSYPGHDRVGGQPTQIVIYQDPRDISVLREQDRKDREMQYRHQEKMSDIAADQYRDQLRAEEREREREYDRQRDAMRAAERAAEDRRDALNDAREDWRDASRDVVSRSVKIKPLKLDLNDLKRRR